MSGTASLSGVSPAPAGDPPAPQFDLDLFMRFNINPGIFYGMRIPIAKLEKDQHYTLMVQVSVTANVSGNYSNVAMVHSEGTEAIFFTLDQDGRFQIRTQTGVIVSSPDDHSLWSGNKQWVSLVRAGEDGDDELKMYVDDNFIDGKAVPSPFDFYGQIKLEYLYVSNFCGEVYKVLCFPQALSKNQIAEVINKHKDA